MASPNVFLASPSGGSKRKPRGCTSSSPDLPPLQDIITQRPGPPPFKIDSKSTIRDGKRNAINHDFTPEQSRASVVKKASSGKDDRNVMDDNSVIVIDLSMTKSTRGRKPKERKLPSTKPKTQRGPAANEASSAKPKRPKKAKAAEEVEETSRNRSPEKEVELADHLPKAGETSRKLKKAETNEPLHLEPAAARRLDWTPPSRNERVLADSDEPTPSAAEKDPSSKSFEKVLEGFKCQENTRQGMPAVSDDDSSFLRKRKLLELVATSAVNTSTADKADKSPMKQKAPKKKARTITELATAAYRVPDPSELEEDTPLDKYLVPNQGVEAKGEEKTTNAKPKKKASKAKKKPKSPSRPALLPPTEALREAANQDFVFGTSSQLALENSPSFLRDLQTAMQNSNQPDYIDLDTVIDGDHNDMLLRRPKLWDAGARDADGELFDLEVSKLKEMPSQQVTATQQESNPFGYCDNDDDPFQSSPVPEENAKSPDATHISILSDDSITTNEIPAPIIDDDLEFSSSQVSMSSQKSIDQGVSRGDEVTERNPFAVHVNDMHRASIAPERPCIAPRPIFDSLTDAQLSKEIKSFGFKPVRSRTAKIALLEQCWQSKQHEQPVGSRSYRTKAKKPPSLEVPMGELLQTGSSSRAVPISAFPSQEPPPSAQPLESPPRPRGRPRKNTVESPVPKAAAKRRPGRPRKNQVEQPSTPGYGGSAPQMVIEIPDSASESEVELSMSPQSSPGRAASPPLAVDLTLTVTEDADMSLVAESTSEEAVLFSHITKAIKTTPRTTDPTNPSWHEKILLYDTIILEDLTAWLNSGQLTRVGFDSEIHPGLVKKWCESKSVCCVWRINLKGKERKRL